MGELGLNKIMGAAFATALVILGLQTLTGGVFGAGGHHGGHKAESLNQWAEETFPGYHPEIKEAVAGGPPVEEKFDLGLGLATADLARGERSMGGKCVSCHSWQEGGANGTGPALYGVVGRDIGGASGFGYSRAFEAYEGNWTYEELDGFLKNPKQYIKGTNMTYAGVKNDAERASIIAYLASLQPNPPSFPEPLETAATEDAVEGEVADLITEGEEALGDAAEAAEGVANELTTAVEEVVETVEEVTGTDEEE